MECPNCHEPTEDGAVYCGNCGHALHSATALTTATPAYAMAVPAQRAGEVKALLSVLLGAAGLMGSVFIAVFGLALGLAGLILGTLSRHSPKRALSTVGLVMSSLAIIAGLAIFVHNFHQEPRLNKIAPVREEGPVTITSGSGLSTPCYSANLAETFNVSHSASGCNLQMYNGHTFEVSSEIYKIYASQSQIRTDSGFHTLAKQALENDFRTNLKTFSITGQREATFAGSPAYVIEGADRANNIAVIEVAVFHQAPTGENVFILLHGTNGDKADLQLLESQWVWK